MSGFGCTIAKIPTCDDFHKLWRLLCGLCVLKIPIDGHISLKTILVWHKHGKNDLYDHWNWFVLKNKPKTRKNTHTQPIFMRILRHAVRSLCTRDTHRGLNYDSNLSFYVTEAIRMRESKVY